MGRAPRGATSKTGLFESGEVGLLVAIAARARTRRGAENCMVDGMWKRMRCFDCQCDM